MVGPRRIQRRRGRGSRLEQGAVDVGRSTPWGNPFRITRSSDYHGLPGAWFLMDDTGAVFHPDEDTQRSARQKAVDLYAQWLAEESDPRVTQERIRSELAGRNLACWCPSDQPCHADVLLQIANAPADAPFARTLDVPTENLVLCPRCSAMSSLGELPAVEATDPRVAFTGVARDVVCSGCGTPLSTGQLSTDQ